MTSITQKYFNLEAERSLLASKHDYEKLKETYSSRLSLVNKNTGGFWDDKFASKHEIYLKNPMEEDRNKTATSILLKNTKKGSRILNIGCGDGNIERLIYGKVSDCDYLGIDLAENTIDKLKKKYPKFHFKKVDVTKMDSHGIQRHFDIVMMFEVLEHIAPQNALKVLRKVNKLLDSDGMLILSVPMNEGLQEMYPYNPNEHLRCYTEALVKAELEISGFKVTSVNVFYAFDKNYFLKKLLAETIFPRKWNPNNILVSAKKI